MTGLPAVCLSVGDAIVLDGTPTPITARDRAERDTHIYYRFSFDGREDAEYTASELVECKVLKVERKERK